MMPIEPITPQGSFSPEIAPHLTPSRRLRLIGVSVLLLIFVTGTYFLGTPNRADTVITVSSGMTLRQIATLLKEEGVIRIPEVFMTLVVWNKHGKSVPAGSYFLSGDASVFALATQMGRGDFQIPVVRVTIPEGLTVTQMANVYHTALSFFNETAFIGQAKSREGYLFPDTYDFFANASPETIITRMTSVFNKKLAPREDDIAHTKHTLQEIITMASLIEDEAATMKDRKLVSGILWKRLSIGMPLQVDATLRYVTGKGSHELSQDDLLHDGAYNTYTRKGLPPTPINNPGLDAIDAALYPENSPYFFYLSDKDGRIHYAKDFEEHKQNRLRYLP